jgi:outer membrane protein assembly factor BamB
MLLAGFCLVLARHRAFAGILQGSEPQRAWVLPVTRSQDWPKYCASLDMTGSALGTVRIRRDNVASLTPLWSIVVPGPIASSPAVVGQTLYQGDWSGAFSAIDEASGQIRAQTALGQTAAMQCQPAVIGITSAPHVVRGRVYIAGGDDAFYCLDGKTLATVWRTPLGDNTDGYYGWSSPAVVGDRVLQGVSSECDNPFIPGQLVALDAGTGAIRQQATFVPNGVKGAGVWTSPAVDLVSGKIFVTTASALQLADGLAFSIVRLSLDDLAIEDAWKVDPHGVPDADWGSSPTLFRDGAGRELVGAGQKDGGYYAFDRANLVQGPVWIALISRGGECPQCGDGTLSTAGFDGKHLYIAGGVAPDVPSPQNGSTVVALDPATGTIVWRRSFPGGPGIAPVSVAQGVLFAVAGRQVLALDTDTGDTLWSFVMSNWGYSGVAIRGDRIYVGDSDGHLYAFGLSSPEALR